METMEKFRRLSGAGLLLCSALGAPLVSGAAEESVVKLAVEVGVGVTDNIERTDLVGRSETLSTAGVQFRVHDNSRRMNVDLSGGLALLHYPDGTYDDDLIGSVQGEVQVSLVPEYLAWAVEDNFGQTRQDLFEVPSPDNTENINRLVTGPDLTLPLGQYWNVRASARYGRIDYQKSPYDSMRYIGSLGIEHLLSGGSSVSLEVNSSRIDPKADLGTTRYDLQAAMLDYSMRGARTSFNVELGLRRIKQDDGASESGVLLGFDLTRRIGNSSNLQVSLGREYGDNGDVMRIADGQLPIGTEDGHSLTRTTDPFTLDRLTLAYGISGRRTDINVSAYWTREKAAFRAEESRDSVSYAASVVRQLGSRLEGNVILSHSRSDFDDLLVRRFRETHGAIGLTWRMGARLFSSVLAQYYQYKAAGSANSVEERRVWLRMGFGSPDVRSQGAAAIQ